MWDSTDSFFLTKNHLGKHIETLSLRIAFRNSTDDTRSNIGFKFVKDYKLKS